MKVLYNLSRFVLQHQLPLPIYSLERKIVESVQSSPVTIVSAATGSGKSTQIVQYLMDAGMTDKRYILCIQPRKLAVWTLAKRVSQELNSSTLVGFKVGGGFPFLQQNILTLKRSKTNATWNENSVCFYWNISSDGFKT